MQKDDSNSSVRHEDDSSRMREPANDRDNLSTALQQPSPSQQLRTTGSNMAPSAAADTDGNISVVIQEESKNQEENDGCECDGDTAVDSTIERVEHVPSEGGDVQGDHDNFVVSTSSIPVVASDSAHKSNLVDPTSTNHPTIPDHEEEERKNPSNAISASTVEHIPGMNLPVSHGATVPVILHHPPFHHLYYQDHPGNAQDGGETYYPYPPVPELGPSQPWMMVNPSQQVAHHPFHHHQQQQQQIDHAVAYANAAAHVAWAAAQAVQQAVLQQQTNMFPPYPPPSHHLLMGAPPSLIAPPPPAWPPYMSPQGAIPHYYNPNFTPPQYRLPDLSPSIAHQQVETEESPYFEQNSNDRTRQEPIDAHLDDEYSTVRSLPDTEPATTFNQSNSGRLGWYPRKRQQRVSLTESNGSPSQPYMPSPPPTRDKIRRRLRSSDNDSSSSGSHYYHSKQSWNDGSMKGSRPNTSNQRNSSGRGHNSNSMNKKARSTNNETLIGKTGLAALFEWCSKRHCTPTFTIQKMVLTPPATVLDDEFECIVFLEQPLSANSTKDTTSTGVVDKKPTTTDDANCEDGFLHEWGRGYGRNKNAAKQDSARRAMQALIHGVQFDEETGILSALPPLTTNNAASYLDDLAPNLAKRLEISCDDPPNRSDDVVQASGNISGATIKYKTVTHQKRTLGTYPETSTTSEDDDRSTYYASRGASVCSVLLHTIIQIDKKRIPDMPTFSYELSPPVVAGNGYPPKETEANTKSLDQVVLQQNMERSTLGKQAVTRCTSGSFKCIAKLKILTTRAENDVVDHEGDTDNKAEVRHEEKIIEAIGLGGTKRDARHVASAKLLSLLFPECNNDMAKVKAAAESMRDQYAASKIQKHQNQMTSRYRRRDVKETYGELDTPIEQENCANLTFALSLVNDPPLPDGMNNFFANLCSRPVSFAFESSNDSQLCEQNKVDVSASTAFRQLGRQKQMDYLVDSALQRFNELDDEGRLICGGGNEDDVGRTVLRRAEPSDLSRIKKLMQSKRQEKQAFERSNRDNYPKRNAVEVPKGRTKHQVSELSSTLADVTINGEISNQLVTRLRTNVSTSQLWSSTSSTVLLLCRAISAFEDPPLGCAYLSFDFSMEKGKVLRVVEIGSESHLPQERFLDCLQSFATCMNFAFEPSRRIYVDEQRKNQLHYTTNDLLSIVASFTKRRRDELSTNIELSTVADDVELGTGGKRFQALRPVQEESERSDDDDSKSSGSQMVELPHPTNKPPGSVKPSKRSRFQ